MEPESIRTHWVVSNKITKSGRNNRQVISPHDEEPGVGDWLVQVLNSTRDSGLASL